MMARRINSRRGAIVLPILLEDAPIPPLLEGVKYIDLRDKDVARGVKQLSDAIFYQRKKGNIPQMDWFGV